MSQDLDTHSRIFNELLKRLFKNSSILFSGNLWVSILGLASFALTAKALGTEQFGLLVLVTTYVLLIDKLVNFQAWRALIKFGSDPSKYTKKQASAIIAPIAANGWRKPKKKAEPQPASSYEDTTDYSNYSNEVPF